MSMATENLLAGFIGHWAGEGTATYSTTDSFQYSEGLVIKPYPTATHLHYEQNTLKRLNGELVPAHRETGFIRLLDAGRIEIVNAQSGGRVEILEGTVIRETEMVVASLHSRLVQNDDRVIETSRVLRLEGNVLHYAMHMATTTTTEPELLAHLEATLLRYFDPH